MMGTFHRPIYEWKVRQWAVTDSALRKDETGNGSTWCIRSVLRK